MSAPIIEIADEIVALVNAELIVQGEEAVASRKYNPIVNLKDMSGLRCVVYASRNLSENDLVRSNLSQHEYEIQILFQKKLGTPDTEEWYTEIDDLTELVDAIADIFRPGDYQHPSKSFCSGVDIDPIFAPEHIDQKNLFSSVVNLTYRQHRIPD